MLPNLPHFLLPFDFVVHVWEKASSNEHPVSFNVWSSFFSQLLYMESPQATSENLRSVFNLRDLALDHQNSFDDAFWIWWTVGVTVGLSSFPGHCLCAVCTESDGKLSRAGACEHWRFQARMPGSNSGQLWLLLMETRSGSAACITYQGNFAALKPLTHVNKATVCIIDFILAGRSSISIAGSVYWGVHIIAYELESF